MLAYIFRMNEWMNTFYAKYNLSRLASVIENCAF